MVSHPTYEGQTRRSGGGPLWRFTEWLCGVIGAVAVFLGLFISFAGEDQYVGLGGDWSWRVGDVGTAWIVGLLIGGVVLMAVTVFMVMAGRRRPAWFMHDRELAGFLQHAGIFLGVNAFIWIQDIAVGGGLEYAYWVTIPWALGLLIHASTYLYRRGRQEQPMPQQVREESPRELQPH